VSPSIAPSRTKVCALCGASLDGLRPDARFCRPACRVEAGRITTILSPENSKPYLSVAERLRACQEAYKVGFRGNDGRFSDADSALTPQTAIGRLLSGTFGRRQLRKPKAQPAPANEQLRLFV
jgi:hypothetical protein